LEADEVLTWLRSLGDPKAVAGMARFGINPKGTYGVSIPRLRKMAKELGTDHRLALKLWATAVHEARILASMIDDPNQVTVKQMEVWVKDFDSWDVCDQCCSNLFDKSRFAVRKAIEWSSRKEEFVKRAGFVLMAALAVHDKDASDATFHRFLAIVDRECTDERNFVKKAVNWVLRQIGKRNLALNKSAIDTARKIRERESKTARWIASDALRELTSRNVQRKIRSTKQLL
jgi:3-methyladenine DNA glycosylase AlkD